MKRILKKTGLLLGSLCIAGACILSILYGFTIGNFISLAIGVLLISLSLWFCKLPVIWRKMIGILISILLCFFLVVISMVIVRGGQDTATYQEDCVIVLGSGIRGETVLPTLQSRLDKCLEYHRKNSAALILVSGGQGHNEDISEAEAMKRYLIQHGVPDHQVIMENQSRNTVENFLYSQPILDNYFAGRTYSVACVTSDYHIFRAESTAKKQDLQVHTLSAGVKWYLRPSAYTREFLSILKFWILD